MLSDQFNNWNPHPSPDGKPILVLSYDQSAIGQPANGDLALPIPGASDGRIRTVVNIQGGAGTI